jgi:hypothetical protein
LVSNFFLVAPDRKTFAAQSVKKIWNEDAEILSSLAALRARVMG